MEGTQGRIPLSEKISEQLAHDIANRNFVGRLPSIKTLAEKYGTSKATLRSAVEPLAARGVIDVKHGSGMYITGNLDSDDMTPEERIAQAIPDLHDLGQYLTYRFRVAEAGFGSNPNPNTFDELVAMLERLSTFNMLATPIDNKTNGVENEGLFSGNEHLLVPFIRRHFSDEFAAIINHKQIHPEKPLNPAVI